jgi:hypothetical protein
VRCETNSGTITIRLLRNGVNAIYGADAFIEKDSIYYYNEAIPGYQWDVRFFDSLEIISIDIYEARPAILFLDGIAKDTFSLTTRIRSVGECCVGYEVTSVSHNGQIICTGVCDEIIEVEI